MNSRSADRIELIDMLRGWALFGMLLVHFQYYTPRGGAQDWVHAAVDFAAEGKFYMLFAFLFGVSFGIQLLRADERGGPFAVRFLRRLAVLLVIGFLVQTFTGYTILTFYALWGVPLLFVRRWPTRVLFALAIVSLAGRPIRTLVVQGWYSATGDAARADVTLREWAAAQQAVRAEKQRAQETGTYTTVVRTQARQGLEEYAHHDAYLLNEGFALFLMGLIAVRRRIFHEPRAHARTLRWAIVVGLGSAVLAAVLGYVRANVWAPEFALRPLNFAVPNLVFMVVRQQWLGFTYAGLLVLLVTFRDRWRVRLAPLAWAGRMALTSYIVQVVLLEALFTRYLLGVALQPVMGVVLTFGLFAAQAAASRWWLARYRYGPVEWVWRCLTDLELHALRRRSETAVALAA